jgi:hypothetical protein
MKREDASPNYDEPAEPSRRQSPSGPGPFAAPAGRSPMMTSLSRYLPRAAASATEMENLRRRAWRQDGVLSLRDGDDRLSWPERELVRQLGERLYGSRRDHGALPVDDQQGRR